MQAVESEVCPLFFRLGTGEAMTHAFAAADFANVRAQRFDSPLVYADTDAAREAAFLGGPVPAQKSKLPTKCSVSCAVPIPSWA